MKILLLLLLTPLPLLAQTTFPKTALQAREQRAKLLLDEIQALDKRIEDRLERIIDGLGNIADSKDSKTKVARLKAQTVEALRKNIGYYQRKRADIQEQLRRPTLNLTADQKRKLLTVLDSRIEKRVQQILALEKSLPSHKDYDRYTKTGDGWWGSEFERNSDFEQNRRVTTHTDQMREKVLAGLDQSIAKLEQQQRTLQSAPPSDLVKAELARNETLLTERRQQRAEVVTERAEASREVSQKEAMDLDSALRRATEELRRDFTTLFARYNAYLPALAAVNAAKAQSKPQPQ
jgi:hypothetical protein